MSFWSSYKLAHTDIKLNTVTHYAQYYRKMWFLCWTPGRLAVMVLANGDPEQDRDAGPIFSARWFTNPIFILIYYYILSMLYNCYMKEETQQKQIFGVNLVGRHNYF